MQLIGRPFHCTILSNCVLQQDIEALFVGMICSSHDFPLIFANRGHTFQSLRNKIVLLWTALKQQLWELCSDEKLQWPLETCTKYWSLGHDH